MPNSNHTTEYLANERTYLAWIRTCIAIISFGFVVAKFSVWLRELAFRLNPNSHMPSSGMSLPIGVGMMALGGVLAVLSVIHYHAVNRAIEQGDVNPSRRLVNSVSIAVTILAIMMIAYMLLTANHL